MNNYLVRITAVILLAGILCALAGCQERNIGQQSIGLDYTRFQTTKEEVDAQHAQFGKDTREYSTKSQFAIDHVVITVYPFANDVEYTAEDFSEIGCMRVVCTSDSVTDNTKPTKRFRLYFEGRSKRDVLNAIEVLLRRDDVYRAQPDFIYSIDP